MLKTQIDPFTVEIIRSALIATTDEMKTNLARTAYNPIVYEAQDFTVAVTDRNGNLASIGLGLPSFIRGISDVVKGMIKHWGTDLHPGDILLCNDTQIHGSHLNHVIMAIPVFVDGEIIAFACSEPHWADIGGVSFAQSRSQIIDIFGEGLQIPFVKVYKKGEVNQDVIDFIRMNVRNPELAMGDFRGQVACARTGEKRLMNLGKKYGKEAFISAFEIIMDKSEAFSRAQLLKVPDGEYEATQYFDDDGIDIGRHMNLKVKIKKEKDTMIVDLTEVDPQVRSRFNSGAAISGAQMGFKTLICSTWYPVNDGSFRPLKVLTKPGTFVTAQRPAALFWWMIPPMNIADTMWHAMAPAMPDGVCAGHFATLAGGGGWGAKYNQDGMSAMHCLNDGDVHNTPVEAAEVRNQNLVTGNQQMWLRRELRQDSGGAGKYRGGLGCVEETVRISMRGNFQGGLNFERTTSPPWGAFGAKPGLANAMKRGIPKTTPTPEEVATRKLFTLDVEWEEYPNAKYPSGKAPFKELPIGSRTITMLGGGGGYGNPLERGVSKVLDDVINGYVSVEAAERDYGVVVNPKTMTVDEAATRTLRK